MKLEQTVIFSLGSLIAGSIIGFFVTLFTYNPALDVVKTEYMLRLVTTWALSWTVIGVLGLAIFAWDTHYKDEPEEKSSRKFLFGIGFLSPIIFLIAFFAANPLWDILQKWWQEGWPGKISQNWKNFWDTEI